MKTKNLLLVVPLLLTTAVSLTSCSEDQKHATKAATNIRIENQILKWDIPFSLEYPFTEVKINGYSQLVGDKRELDLSNLVQESGKLEVELVTKPYYMNKIFKDTSVKQTFDVKCLEKPTYKLRNSLLVGVEYEFIFDSLTNDDVLYEVCFYDNISYFRPGDLFFITKQIKESCSVRIRAVSESKECFNSPYVYENFIVLDTPKLKLEGNMLSWDSVDFAKEYYIDYGSYSSAKVTGTSFELPIGIKEGQQIFVTAKGASLNYIPSKSGIITYKK